MQLFSNNAQSTLAAAITNVATSLTVATGEGSRFPNPTGGDFFIITLFKLSGVTESAIEIVKCTARSGDVLTVVRGQEGTMALAYAAGDYVALRLTAGGMVTDSVAEGSANKYFTTPRVLNTVLSGLSVATNQVVAATDTVLGAIGYLQRQVSDLLASLSLKATIASPSFTGTATFVATKDTKVVLSGTSIDLSAGSLFTKTISGATTLSLINVPGAGVASFMLDITNAGSAAITWWTNLKWPGGTAPTLTMSGRDLLGFVTHDGGSTWSGLVLGKDIK